MSATTSAPPRTYSPKPYNPVYAPILAQPRGLEIMNMLWISRPFNSRGIVDLRDPGLVRSVIDTLNCSASTCERRNPYSLDPAGNISALLLLPPELFAAWLNKLPMDLLVKLPMHQLLGADWLTTVNRRLPLCSTAFDDVHDVSLAQEALRKHLR